MLMSSSTGLKYITCVGVGGLKGIIDGGEGVEIKGFWEQAVVSYTYISGRRSDRLTVQVVNYRLI